MTELLFRDDPYLLAFDARIVERRTHDGRPAVVLDRTAFYAESGGQPWDTGTLGGVPVVAVVEHEGRILHLLERPLDADAVQGRVDADRRRDHRQQHHGQHLLSRAFVDLASARTVSFHLGAETSSIDLDREIDERAARAAEARTNEIVWSAKPVRVRVVSRAEAEAMGLRPAPEAGDAIRLVEAEGFDLQPCGGTHPRSTSEVGVVVVLDHEKYKGGSRVHFVCGHRAVQAFAARNAALLRLAALVSAPPSGVVAAVEKLREQNDASAKRNDELREKALAGEAQRLVAGRAPRDVVRNAYDGWPPADLRTVAVEATKIQPCLVLLGSRSEGKAHLVFAQTPGLGFDVPAVLRKALEHVGGRGGGRGDVAQGGGDRVEGLDDALAAAAAAVRA